MTDPRSPNSANALAFEFVSLLARELSEGKVDLPGFPHVFARVCKALGDPTVGAEQMAAIVGAEPGLAVRLMAVANSVAFNPSNQPVGDLPAAIVRLGDNNVRSAASAFAIAQLRHAAALQSVAPRLEQLWDRSTQVAAICYVIATASKLSSGEAFLAGLLHGIGELYVLARMSGRADLLSTSDEVAGILANWHAPIGKSLLENWMFPTHIVEAIEEQDNAARRPHALADVADVLICAKVLHASGKDPEEMRRQCASNRAFRQLRLDAERGAAVLVEAAAEIGALRAMVGG